MRAMILAAGRGTRMRHLTENTPKPLLQVGGKPLIVWHIERLAGAGFTELVINHAYLGSKIEQALGNGEQWGVHIQYSAETTALETAGGIAKALPLLGDAPFLVVNGDVFTDIDFAKLKTSLSQNQQAHLVLVDNPPQHPEGDFYLNAGKVSAGENTDTPTKLTFAGVGVYSPELFASVECGQPAKLAPLLKSAMSKGLVSGQHYQGVWHDIGTPERLDEINRTLQSE